MRFTGPMFVTPHANRRWRERINPRASDPQAIREILEALSYSKHIRTDDRGTEHWRANGRCPWGRVRFLVRRGEGPLPSVVTVLKVHDNA